MYNLINHSPSYTIFTKYAKSWKVILVGINTYLASQARRTIIMWCVFRCVCSVSLVPYNIAHLDLVTMALLKWSTSTMPFMYFQVHIWMVVSWLFLFLFKHLLAMILPTHYSCVSLSNTFLVQLAVFRTLMHDCIWWDTTRFHSNKPTRTLQTIT